jgi:hypothetical protein
MFRRLTTKVIYEIGVRGFATIPEHLRIVQGKGDYNCMVASAATAFNVKSKAKIYDLPKMKTHFDSTLLVGDSNGSGYDNRNFKCVSEKLGYPVNYWGYNSKNLQEEKLKEALPLGNFMITLRFDTQAHSCLLCEIDKYGQYLVYDPAHGMVLTYQRSEFWKLCEGIDYLI